jgi:hypothetical protein
MKLIGKRFIFFILLCVVVFSCSKGTQTASPTNAILVDTAAKPNTISKLDTVTVMAYNVLYYGDYCQNAPNVLDNYFKTIIGYAKPDLLSCEKVYTFLATPGSNGNLADEIVSNVLNPGLSDQYAYATPTNKTGAKNMQLLFYNTKKFTYVKTETIVANVTDFNLYQLYYNDINLAITHDTTFLYVLVNHTQSGSSSTTRDQQVTLEMTTLRYKFSGFPNLINMGDFNTSASVEAGYQSVINPADSGTMMYDPPYFPDKLVKYPGYWDASPQTVAPFLTTSTRSSATIPNSCGTDGGAKGWYDHIFISPWLVNGSNYITYIPGSYKVIGNDGNRIGVDINASFPVTNLSVPATVQNALFQFSNKYPVMLKLSIKANRNSVSPADPIEKY